MDDKKYVISKIKINNDYVSLLLDDTKIMISIDDYYEYKLSENKEISEDLFEQLKKNENKLKAYRSCLRKLSIKDYSISSIRKSLYRYDLDKDQIKEIIDKLIKYGFLDDEKYCINKAQYYERSLMSYNSIKAKLLKEGIDKDIIEDNVRYDHDNECEKAEKYAEKAIKSITNKSSRAKKQSILTKLVNAGYLYETARSVTDNMNISSENELELLQREYDKVYRKYIKKYEGYELRSKIYSSLLLKGFNSEDIKTVMEVSDEQES